MSDTASSSRVPLSGNHFQPGTSCACTVTTMCPELPLLSPTMFDCVRARETTTGKTSTGFHDEGNPNWEDGTRRRVWQAVRDLQLGLAVLICTLKLKYWETTASWLPRVRLYARGEIVCQNAANHGIKA